MELIPTIPDSRSSVKLNAPCKVSGGNGSILYVFGMICELRTSLLGDSMHHCNRAENLLAVNC